jgi:protein translocase SecG subunit
MIAKKWLFATLSGLLILFMNLVILISAVILIVLILLQVRDGGLNVATNSTLQAPIERRGPARTLHIATILVGIVFVG